MFDVFCPCFALEKVQRLTVLVMTDDDRRYFAFDSIPLVSDIAIEAAWIRMYQNYAAVTGYG